jgi:hypothetical protein
VLIDGRFRVACALAVALNQYDKEWVVLVDDYVGRKEYQPIACFLELSGTYGRMAEFHPKVGVNERTLSKALEHFVGDWR